MKKTQTPFFLLILALAIVTARGEEIILWPSGAPEPKVPADPAEYTEVKDEISRRYNVSNPRLFVHLPPAGVTRNGSGVVVVPGGGFSKLADVHEGADACVWLAKQGFVAFQLAHRTPTNKMAEPWKAPVQDVQKAMILARAQSEKYGIKPGQLGLLGFSAGGQAALIASTNDRLFPGTEEAGVSHKPDFLLLIYAYQIYDAATKKLRKEVHPEAGLPPTFIAQMGDDKGSLPQGSALLYLELIERKIPAEIHIYENGGHGFGMNERPGAAGPTDWSKRAADWLKLRLPPVPVPIPIPSAK